MIRDGIAGGDQHVFLAVNAQHRTVFRRRLHDNMDSIENWQRGTNVSWLRLSRLGDTLIGHRSTNGLDWELAWWTTLMDLPTTLQAGLAVTAHRNERTATATFCGWSVGRLTPLSGDWPEAGPRLWIGSEPIDANSLWLVGGQKLLLGGNVGEVWVVEAAPGIVAIDAGQGPLCPRPGVVPTSDHPRPGRRRQWGHVCNSDSARVSFWGLPFPFVPLQWTLRSQCSVRS